MPIRFSTPAPLGRGEAHKIDSRPIEWVMASLSTDAPRLLRLTPSPLTLGIA